MPLQHHYTEPVAEQSRQQAAKGYRRQSRKPGNDRGQGVEEGHAGKISESAGNGDCERGNGNNAKGSVPATTMALAAATSSLVAFG